MVLSKSLVLAEHPLAFPIPGKDLIITTTEFNLEAPLPEGGIVLKTNFISYDPYQRGRMKATDSGYVGGYKLGEPINNNAISTVVSSSNQRFKKGDVVIGAASFAEYQAISKERADKPETEYGFSVLSNPLNLAPEIYLGALGMSGLTAYSSLYEAGTPKKGESIFISAASGAVGMIVGQLAKREGMKVIGSVGSKEKLEWIKEIGFDAGFNYKDGDVEGQLRRCLKEIGEEGIDVYYDNVSGEQLDAALACLKTFGRIVSCGNVSQTSKKDEDKYAIKNMGLVVPKRLRIRGILVTDPEMGPKYREEHHEKMGKWIKDGDIAIKMSYTEGMENAAEGLVGMLKGQNFGKAVLRVADF